MLTLKSRINRRLAEVDMANYWLGPLRGRDEARTLYEALRDRGNVRFLDVNVT